MTAIGRSAGFARLSGFAKQLQAATPRRLPRLAGEANDATVPSCGCSRAKTRHACRPPGSPGAADGVGDAFADFVGPAVDAVGAGLEQDGEPAPSTTVDFGGRHPAVSTPVQGQNPRPPAGHASAPSAKPSMSGRNTPPPAARPWPSMESRRFYRLPIIIP